MGRQQKHGGGVVHAPTICLVPVPSTKVEMDGVEFCNFGSKEEFVETFGNVVEHTQKVADELLKQRPFSSSDSFLDALKSVIESLSESEKVGILVGHPDLAGRIADANLLTPESTREQKEAGLDLLTVEEKARLKSHNDQYREKFGFTFI